MIPPPPIRPGRERLGFKPSALSAFRFLEEMGLSVARAEDTLVRYESGAVFVNIYHGRASCEVGLEVGLRERKPSPHPISRRPTERLGYDQFHYDGSYPYGPGFFAHAASVLRSIVHMVTGPRDPSYPKQYP